MRTPSSGTDDSASTRTSGPASGSRRRGPRKRAVWFEPIDAETGHEVVPTEAQRTRLAERSMNLCVWHVAQGPRTVAQLRGHLAKRQVPGDIVETTLDRLLDLGYLNDTAYAENFVRSRHEVARKGARVIQQELRRKGIPDDVVSDALEAIDPDAEVANARLLVAKKMGATRGMDRAKRTNRLAGMLARRGYPGNVVFAVVREALDAEDPSDGDTQ